jgi:hypothetical protein
MNDYDRLLKSPVLNRLQELSAQEFETAAKRLVEREFEIARQRGARKAPITGEEIYYDAPPEHQTQLEERAVRAVLAKKWFAECEAPPWALALGGLPLSPEEIVALRNGVHQGKPRPGMLAGYGQHLRGAGWMLEYALPFERFAR